MLYTRKGDDGTTKKFDCSQRFSKSSKITEALGSLDEVNAMVGLLRSKISTNFLILDQDAKQVLFQIQEDLFIIQAELAGAPKKITKDKVHFLEHFVDGIEKELPKITSFFIAGEDFDSALTDLVRTVVRRAERRVVDANEEKLVLVSKFTLAYLNRLSSFFYALERWINKERNITERQPSYN